MYGFKMQKIMRVKFPQILCFQEWFDLWNLVKVDKSFQETESKELREMREKVIETLGKNKEYLLEIEKAMLDYVQALTVHNPSVYLAKTKDIKTDRQYLTAKIFWPLMGGKKKEVRIYLGKPDDFAVNPTQHNYYRSESATLLEGEFFKIDNKNVDFQPSMKDMLDRNIKKIATKKMQETLKRRIEDGDL